MGGRALLAPTYLLGSHPKVAAKPGCRAVAGHNGVWPSEKLAALLFTFFRRRDVLCHVRTFFAENRTVAGRDPRSPSGPSAGKRSVALQCQDRIVALVRFEPVLPTADLNDNRNVELHRVPHQLLDNRPHLFFFFLLHFKNQLVMYLEKHL